MRSLLLLLLTTGCTLLTDFDRDLKVVLEITGTIPEPQFTTPLDQAREACLQACTLAQRCLYDPEVAPDCEHAPAFASYQQSNDDILLHVCVGVCVESSEILATGPQDLETCEDFDQKPLLKITANGLFCSGDVSICGELLCAAAGDNTILETCIDIDLFGTCVPNCESLPEEYWTCAAEDAFFQGARFERRNPMASEEEKDEASGQALCQALGRCAGAATRGFDAQ